jgi:hypothetical protein
MPRPTVVVDDDFGRLVWGLRHQSKVQRKSRFHEKEERPAAVITESPTTYVTRLRGGLIWKETSGPYVGGKYEMSLDKQTDSSLTFLLTQLSLLNEEISTSFQ